MNKRVNLQKVYNTKKYIVDKHIRITKEEADDWERKARMIGFKQSSMIRALVMGYEPKAKPDFRFFEDMGRITNLADEIRLLRNELHTSGGIDEKAMTAEIAKWQKLRRELEKKYLTPDPGFMLLHKLPKDLQIKYSGQLNK